ncbi:hypothetical protein [Paenibacillus sp. NFR01]|uniref:hypothetical protein n=1 Tax=Paenibacillus sp. NFR01 TaxID=1566279 RepID=UPI0008CEC534|nr:hypothetical protein [Paenibacillus sp. NFR01]SET61891.1 hypothetical protein SAMN03159358_2202 [Paenibacillus sp. NFR01]
MKNITNELYDLVYKNSVWPQDLLDNLKDPDYLSVKFDAYLKGTMAEVIFMDEGKKIVANYYFNSKGLVQKIEMIEDEKVFVIYSRIDEIAKVLLETNNMKYFEQIYELIAA